MKQFSKGEALSFGWETFKKYPWLLIAVTLTVSLIPFAVSFMFQLPFQSETSESSNPLMLIGTIASNLLSVFFTIAMIKFSLKLVDGKTVEYQDIFNVKAEEFTRYLLGSIIYGIIVFVGFILLVIPGIYFAIKYQYFSYLILDKELSPMEGIKQSGKITQGHKWNLLLLYCILALIQIAGVIALLVGLLVAAPVTGLAYAYVYRKLSPKS